MKIKTTAAAALALAAALAAPAVPEPGVPRLCVVIDDFGLDYKPTPPDAEWAALPFPVTWAVMPDSPRTKKSAALARERGIELILHFPFDPYQALALPKDALDPGDAAKVAAFLDKALAQVPGAAGLNNHRSPRATRHRPMMREFMRRYKPKGLYFLDSKVSPRSVAYAEARAAGLRAAENSIFLDTAQVHTKEFCVGMLRRAAEKARREGAAVAIGHHYFRSTLDCLREEAPRLAAAGVAFAPASAAAR